MKNYTKKEDREFANFFGYGKKLKKGSSKSVGAYNTRLILG